MRFEDHTVYQVLIPGKRAIKSACLAVMMTSVWSGSPLLGREVSKGEIQEVNFFMKERLALGGNYHVSFKVIRTSENFRSTTLASFMCKSDLRVTLSVAALNDNSLAGS